MDRSRTNLCILGFALARFCVGYTLLADPQPQLAHVREQNLNRASLQGQGIFSSSCSGCHGLDGRGGERAPNISQKREVQRLSDGELAKIVREGVPGTGMPAFRTLPATDVKAVVAYLRVLQGASKPVRIPGSPEHGREVFVGKGRCSECHMVAGSGGFIASDLSGYARVHSFEEIRSAIIKPGPVFEGRGVVAVSRDGQKYVGRVRNEDNFSLQLQTSDGAFHFLAKADLDRLEPDSEMLMPSDYGSTLSSRELDDVVSYLGSSGKSSASETGRKTEE